MRKSSITDSDLLVLGLIAEKPRHGYDLEQVIEERGMREWTEIGFSSVYYVCNKLLKLGVIAADEPKSPKARKQYSITLKGREVLNDRCLTALREPAAVRSPIILGLLHWPFLDQQQAIKALNERSQEIAVEIKRLEAVRVKRQPLPEYVNAVFDFSLGQLAVEAAWAKSTIEDLEQNLSDDQE